jgi:hypothetical protein
MIHAHDIQNLLLRGPRTAPKEPGDSELVPVPVIVEIRLPSGQQFVPVQAARVTNGVYVLSIDGAGLVLALAERVAGQSEILAAKAEGKTVNLKEGSGY